jgi:hypothetical protein
MKAILLLTMQMLSVQTSMDIKGGYVAEDRRTLSTTTIEYASITACRNGREELQLAFGAYQMSKVHTNIMSAVCIDTDTGSVQ